MTTEPKVTQVSSNKLLTEIMSRKYNSHSDAADAANALKKKLKVIIPESGQSNENAIIEEIKTDPGERSWYHVLTSNISEGSVKSSNPQSNVVTVSTTEETAYQAPKDGGDPKLISKNDAITPDIPTTYDPENKAIPNISAVSASQGETIKPTMNTVPFGAAPSLDSLGGFSISSYTPKFVTSLPSLVKYEISSKGRCLRYYIDPEYHIEPFSNEVEYNVNINKLISKLQDRYDVMLLSPPKKYYVGWGIKTIDPEYCGFNWEAFHDTLVSNSLIGDDLHTEFLPGMNVLRDSLPKDPRTLSGDGHYFYHPFEAELIRAFRSINDPYIRDVNDFVNFCKLAMDNDKYYIEPLANYTDKDLSLLKFFFPSRLSMFDYLLAQSFGLRGTVDKITSSLVSHYMSIESIAGNQLNIAAAQTLGLGTTVFSEDSEIVTALSGTSTAGGQLLFEILKVMVNGRYLRITVDIPASWSPANFVLALLFKLIMPEWILDPAVVRALNNWFVVHVLMYLRIQGQSVYDNVNVAPHRSRFTSSNIHSEIDMLAELTALVNLPGAILGFLQCWADYDGAMNQMIETVALPQGAVGFTNSGRRIRYRRFIGKSVGRDSTEVLPQVIRYETFLRFLGGANQQDVVVNKLGITMARLSRIIATAGIMLQSSSTLNQMIYAIDEMAHVLSLSSIAHPLEPGMAYDPQQVFPLKVKLQSPVSMMTKLSWNSILTATLEPNVIKYGWRINEYFEQVIFYIRRLSFALSPLHVSKSDIVKLGIDSVPDMVGLKSTLLENLGSLSIMETFDYTNNEIATHIPLCLVMKYEAVSAVMNSYKQWFGISDYISYDVVDRMMQSEHLSKTSVLSKTLVKQYDTFKLTDLYQFLRNGTITSSIFDLIRRGEKITIEHPCWVKEVDYNQSYDVINKAVQQYRGWNVDPTDHIYSLKCTGVVSFYLTEDVYRQGSYLGHSLLQNQIAYPVCTPSHFDTSSYVWNSLHTTLPYYGKYYEMIDFSNLEIRIKMGTI